MPVELKSCPVEGVLSILSGRWKIPIYRHLYNRMEPVRYSELQRHLPAISRKMLTEQLRELEADGIVERTVFEAVPPKMKVQYALTPRGRSMIGFLDMISEWGKHNLLSET